MRNPDILVLEENTKGRDIIVGDLHGSLELLKGVVADLKPNDRLFIVGDLTDNRNLEVEDQSLGVIQLIQKHNELHKNIYVTKGNHETMCIDAVRSEGHSSQWTGFLRNGGAWIMLVLEEKREGIAAFFDSFPYIIHVKGAVPFNVVHADMPFDDNALLNKIREGNLILSSEEQEYSIWARESPRDRSTPPFKKTGRDEDSIITYCGHQMLGRPRLETNTVNLDIGAFANNDLLAVTHKEFSGQLYKLRAEDQFPDVIQYQQNVHQQLQGLALRWSAKDAEEKKLETVKALASKVPASVTQDEKKESPCFPKKHLCIEAPISQYGFLASRSKGTARRMAELLKAITGYEEMRYDDTDEYKGFIDGLGFSRTEKLEAVRLLKDYLTPGIKPTKKFTQRLVDALNNGRLEKALENYRDIIEPILTQNSPQGTGVTPSLWRRFFCF